jgi:ADP-ribosylglycohydrolase
MRLTPLCVFLAQLPPNEMYAAVRLQTLFTHSNEEVIAACYLYTFAISKLINGMTGSKAYEATKKEATESKDLSSR